MFVSFFPRPKLFFWSAIAWTALSMALWYGYVNGLTEASTPGIVGVALFWSAPSLWFDLYFLVAVTIFAGFWQAVAPHPWALWSVWGSALIIFTTYFQVQVSVAINTWYGPFYDLVQAALSKTAAGDVTQGSSTGQLLELRRHRPRRRHGRRADRLLRQPLHLPLAHGDERILRDQLAEAAHHRGRLAARPGRHDAFLHDGGGPRRQPGQLGHDADRLPAGAVDVVAARHRAAADRRGPASAGLGGALLVDLRHRLPGLDRHQPAGT